MPFLDTILTSPSRPASRSASTAPSIVSSLNGISASSASKSASRFAVFSLPPDATSVVFLYRGSSGSLTRVSPDSLEPVQEAGHELDVVDDVRTADDGDPAAGAAPGSARCSAM